MLLLRMSYQDRTVDVETLLRALGEEEPIPEPSGPGSEGPAEGTPRTPSREGTDPGIESPPAPETTRALAEAWARVLEGPTDLPKGVLPFLKAASVDFSEEGEVRMTIPPGPARERLGHPGVIKALKNALANHGQASVEIIISEAQSRKQTSDRITEETVRTGRLQELVAKEPTLGEAVKELDLELLD